MCCCRFRPFWKWRRWCAWSCCWRHYAQHGGNPTTWPRGCTALIWGAQIPCWERCWRKGNAKSPLIPIPALYVLQFLLSVQMWSFSKASSLRGRAAACELRGGSKASCRTGWALWDSTWEIWEWRSLTSSGEFRSSKSSSILSTNSSVNRICKGNTVVYAFTLLILANCQETEWLLQGADCTSSLLPPCPSFPQYKGLRARSS